MPYHYNRRVFNFIRWLSVYAKILLASTFSAFCGFITIVFVPFLLSFFSSGVSVYYAGFFSSGFFDGNILPIILSPVLIGSIYIGSPEPPPRGFGLSPPSGGSYLCCGISPILLSYYYGSGGIYHGI